MEKPDVDEISGIAPAVAIRQKNSTRNPRSNVATATEIYDYLRLLFARCGQTFCIKCGAQVRKDSPDEIATRILSLAAGRRFYVLHQFRIVTPTAAVSKRGAKKTASARLRKSFVKHCSIFRSAVSTGFTRRDESTNFPLRKRCSTSIFRNPSTCLSIGSRSIRNRARGS